MQAYLSRSRFLVAPMASATALSLLMASASFAQDAGLPPVEHEFSNGSTLRFYGQINKGILQYDDGAETESYGLIDNDNSGTRVGLQYDQTFGAWTFQNVNEFAYTPFSTSNINILQQTPPDGAYDFTNANIRKIDFTFDNDQYGKFWIGQGSMATDGIMEIDLSGTDVVAYSGVADSASGQLLRFSDGSLSDTAIGDVYANLDGDRQARVRYDTPAYANFTVAASFGRNLLSDDSDVRDQNLFDASVNYANTFGNIEFAGGAGYNWNEDDTNIWGGSASALHTPTGLNFTLAASSVDDDGDTSNFWYTKLGLMRDFISMGDTAMSLDYYSGEGFGEDAAENIGDASSDSWGVALVQNIDRANTQLWLTYRSYDYSNNSASFQDGSALFGGARFSF